MEQKTPKIRKYKSGKLYIKFRIYKPLRIYFNRNFITKTMKSHLIPQAKHESENIYRHYRYIVDVYKGRLFDQEQLQILVDKYIVEILNQEPSIDFKDSIITYKEAFGKFKTYYENENLKPHTKKQTYQALELFMEIIGKNKDITKTKPFDLLEIKVKLSSLGNRNYKEYKTLSLNEYVKLINIPKEKRINDGTLKSHIKHIKKFFTFCEMNKIINENPSSKLNVKVDLDKKDPFDDLEVRQLHKYLTSMNSKLKWLYLSILYSGMRRSEVYNCSIEIENGIRYFNIHSSKTLNGIRKIPLHKCLSNMSINDLEQAKLIAVNQVNAGAIFAKKIKPHITKSSRKSLHTIRHWIATKLKQEGVQDSMIKQILGHSQKDTLNSVYARDAFSLEQLQHIINML